MDQVKKNFILGSLHEGIWGISFGLINPITVVQQVLADLGGNAQTAGLLAALMFAGMNAPQVVSAFVLPPVWTSPKRTALLHLPSIVIVAALACLLYQPFGFPDEFKKTSFIAGMMLFFLLLGWLVPHWIACHGRNIPDHLLGRFFGIAFGLSGLSGVAGGVLAQHWISSGGTQWGYALCFAVAVPLQLLSVAALTFTQSIGPEPTPAGKFYAYLREQWHNIRHNKTFQTFGIIALFMQLTTAAGMLFTSYLNTRGNAQTVVGWTTAFVQLGGIAGALILGWLEDFKGPRAALAVSFLVFIVSLAWISSDFNLIFSSAAFGGIGFFNAAFPVVTTYLVLTLAPKGRQVVYTGLFNSLMAPWALSPIFLGWVAQRWSYQLAFSLSAAAATAALVLLALARGFGQSPSLRPAS